MSADATIAQVLAGEAQWAVVCADNADVLPTLPDASVAHVITDPPFDQDTSDGARSAKAVDKRLVTFDGLHTADVAWLCAAFLRIGARWSVVFCALEQLGWWKVSSGKRWVRGSAWWRDNAAPQFTGDRPGQRYEGIAIMHPAGRKRWARGGECWSPKGITAMESRGDGHPTPKPVWLMQECVDAFTDPGELVLDPFCGSGTTGVACLRMGRRFIGIERDEKYAAIARERLVAEQRGLTLKDARAGQSSIFDVLERVG